MSVSGPARMHMTLAEDMHVYWLQLRQQNIYHARADDCWVPLMPERTLTSMLCHSGDLLAVQADAQRPCLVTSRYLTGGTLCCSKT